MYLDNFWSDRCFQKDGDIDWTKLDKFLSFITDSKYHVQ